MPELRLCFFELYFDHSHQFAELCELVLRQSRMYIKEGLNLRPIFRFNWYLIEPETMVLFVSLLPANVPIHPEPSAVNVLFMRLQASFSIVCFGEPYKAGVVVFRVVDLDSVELNILTGLPSRIWRSASRSGPG